MPINDTHKDVSTFARPEKPYRFRDIPVGIVNAPTNLSQIMRQLLRESRNLKNYLDDVLGHMVSWSDHLITLRDFFVRVREGQLALRPSKCFISYTPIWCFWT